jgi:PPM family protein phosphatase
MTTTHLRPDPNIPHPIRYYSQAFSLQGLRPFQEDSYLVRALQDSCLVLVADGLGGHGHGDYASQLCTRVFQAQYEHLRTVADPITFLKETAEIINDMLLRKGEEEPDYKYCGTTVSGFLVKERNFYLINAGDSRVYGYDGQQNLTRLTKDHSLVQDLLDRGQLTEEEAFDHPRRNMVTASLGLPKEYFKVDVSGPHPLGPDTVLLATSDGVHDALTDDHLLAVLQERTGGLAQAIAEAALDEGGTDNITVCLLTLDSRYAT